MANDPVPAMAASPSRGAGGSAPESGASPAAPRAAAGYPLVRRRTAPDALPVPPAITKVETCTNQELLELLAQLPDLREEPAALLLEPPEPLLFPRAPSVADEG